MYDVNFETENIFTDKYMYKVHCIGKCQKGHTPTHQDTHYYFISHGKKYMVSEILRGLEDIKITIKEVEDFILPTEDNFEYMLFKREVAYGYKYNLIKRLENMTYSKDGFVIFKQMVYQDTNSALGGIDDIYEYEETTAKIFKEKLDNCEYDK